MKKIIFWILVAIVLNAIAYVCIKQYDVAFENRAKAAGYYEVLPDNMKK